MFRSFGPLEIGLIVLIILIFFGVGKLPQVGAALGKGLRAFRGGQSGESEDGEAKKPEPKPVSKKKVSKKTANKESS